MSLSISADNVTDSIFTWTFTANSGDSWGGTLVDDGTRYDVGSSLTTAHGRYAIVAEATQLGDLSALGFDEGWISLSWYRDRSGVFMLTRNGESVAAGLAGLGTEVDAAWNGSAWDSFGLGGADQADLADLADSLFTWTFTADTGDIIQGTLLADTRDWNAGDTLRTAHGTYRIDTESPHGRDLGGAGVEGTVHILSYSDFHAGIEFTLETGAAGPAGYGGLGSEWDRAWTGAAWVPIGQGGALQADRQPDRVFTFRFVANDGDIYAGTLIGHSTAYQVGDRVDVAGGVYTILAEASFTGAIAAQGQVWLEGYFDSSANTWLATYLTAFTGTPSGRRGLGSEYDYAWDGDEWDDFGLGGVHRATMEREKLFSWTLTATNGDRYGGFLFDDEERWRVGDTLAGAQGTYRIDAADAWPGLVARGTVWTYWYHDQSSGETLSTYFWTTLGAVPSGANGLGSEYDYAWDGDEWDDFGLGGTHTAGVVTSSLHAWSFTADSGDVYSGWLVDDSARYAVGDSWRTGFGRYRIDYETGWAATTARGTVWTSNYFDAQTGQSLNTYLWSVLGAQPSGLAGLGSEYDLVWDGDEWDGFGGGGYYQVRIERDSLYSWYLQMDSGDLYTGLLLDDADAHAAGDTIRGAQGTYVIQSESPSSQSGVGRGTVWTASYYDAPTGSWLSTYFWGGPGGVTPSGRAGLGSEYDYAWDGDEWDDFGLGGVHQVRVERDVLYGWYFRGTSGDIYTGLLLADASDYAPGDTIQGAHGVFTIQSEAASNQVGVAQGAIWTSAYYDAGTQTWLSTYFWGFIGGAPSGRRGFGSEYDYAWDGDEWDDFGVGGIHQAEVERASAPEAIL